MQRHVQNPPHYQEFTTTELSSVSGKVQNCAGPTFVLSGDFLPSSFRSESYQLAKDAINYVCRHDNAAFPPSKTAVILRTLIDDTLKYRLDMLCHMVMLLDVKDREQLKVIDGIATSMFEDEIVNWGRIVTFCAFCGYLARYCEERNIPDCADDVARILGDIVVNRLGLWIVANGGWVRQFG